MRLFFSIIFSLICGGTLFSQDVELSPEQIAMIEQDSIIGETGIVPLNSAHCSLSVPDGFVYLDPYQTEHLLVDYWGNPKEKVEGTLGTLVKADAGIFYNVETAYVVSYEDAGYVSDADAATIDYDELMKGMQESIVEEKKSNAYYQQWELLGWAWHPTYDSRKKVLAWAKHYRVGEEEVINYDVRVLGKAGFVVITAVASPDSKDQLMADNNAIIGSVVYDKGYTYADFKPGTDHVAEWTLGGLIAGKVLAKAGVWAFLAKFSKIAIFAVIAFFAGIAKLIARFFSVGKKDDDTTLEMD